MPKHKNFPDETLLTSLQPEDHKQRVFLQEKGLDASSTISKDLLEKHTPRKKRYKLFNINPRKRSSQRKGSEIALLKKKRSNENRKLIDKQRNKSVSLLRKVKKDYFTS